MRLYKFFFSIYINNTKNNTQAILGYCTCFKHFIVCLFSFFGNRPNSCRRHSDRVTKSLSIFILPTRGETCQKASLILDRKFFKSTEKFSYEEEWKTQFRSLELTHLRRPSLERVWPYNDLLSVAQGRICRSMKEDRTHYVGINLARQTWTCEKRKQKKNLVCDIYVKIDKKISGCFL